MRGATAPFLIVLLLLLAISEARVDGRFVRAGERQETCRSTTT